MSCARRLGPACHVGGRGLESLRSRKVPANRQQPTHWSGLLPSITVRVTRDRERLAAERVGAVEPAALRHDACAREQPVGGYDAVGHCQLGRTPPKSTLRIPPPRLNPPTPVALAGRSSPTTARAS